MINAPINHPDILRALAAAGHKSTVLVADAHYAASTASGSNAKVVHLNLTAGSPTIPSVVEVLLHTVAVEHAVQIQPTPDAQPSEVQVRLRTLLAPLTVQLVERSTFYDMARSHDLALLIVTGDMSRFGNVLLRLAPILEPAPWTKP